MNKFYKGILFLCLLIPGLFASSKRLQRAGNADIVTNKHLKNAAQTSFIPGQSVVYSITVANHGPDDATDVEIIDNAPANTTISGWTATVNSGTVTLPSASGTGNLDETISSLPNGAVVTYEVTVQVPSNYTGSSMSNAASVNSSSTDPDPACPNCSAPTLAATPRADIVTTKDLTDPTKASFAPGEIVEYTINVTNVGPSDAQNLVVRDNAPNGTVISAWTAAVTSGATSVPATSGSGNLNQTVSTLPVGAILTYHVFVQTPSDYVGTLSNTASAIATTPDPRPVCNTCSVADLPTSASADIVTSKVLKDPSQANFSPGDAVTYIITVTNHGPSDAVDVNIFDKAPTGTTMTGWTATVISGNVTLPETTGTGDLDQTIAIVPNGAIIQYEVVVQTPPDFSGPLINTVTVTSPTPDPNPNPNTTSPNLPPSPAADITTTKTLKDPAQADFVPGEAVVYVITVTNNGPSNSTNVNVRDIAPAGTTITGWTAVVNTGNVTLPHASGTGNLNEVIGFFPNGASVTYEVTVQTPPGFTGPLSNTATVTSDTPDPNPNPTTTTPNVPPNPIADLSLVKRLKDPLQTIFTPGDAVVYTIVVTNSGPSDATDVQIKDAAPAGTTISGWTATVTTGTLVLPAVSGTGDLDQTIPRFPDGVTVVYEVTVQTPASYPGGPMKNVATVMSTTPDPTPDCPDCSTTVPSVPTADIVSEKTLKDPAQAGFAAGEDVVYIITVKNNGPDAASDVRVQDIAPAGTYISGWTAAVTTGTVTLPHLVGTGNLDETIPNVPNGAVITFEITVRTPSNYTGTLSNAAMVSSPTNDPDPACTMCTTPSIPAGMSADIVTVKKVKDGTKFFRPGQAVVYTIVVANNGPSDALDVNVRDIAPAGTTMTEWTAYVSKGIVNLPNHNGTGDLNETITRLPDEAEVIFEVTLQTTETYTGSIQNTATVTSTTPDPDPSCTDCSSPTIVPGSNIPPTAIDDAAEVKEANTVNIPVVINDIPGDAVWGPIAPSTVKIIDLPAHGVVTVLPDGTVEYRSLAGYNGPDTFTYQVQDVSGNWSNVATVTVQVLRNDLDIPNLVTPNGDGNNDRLVIKGLEKYTEHEFVIFNRWNNMLFRSRNYQGQWDGQGLNAGTYFYTLRVLDVEGKWHTVNGYITLMR